MSSLSYLYVKQNQGRGGLYVHPGPAGAAIAKLAAPRSLSNDLDGQHRMRMPDRATGNNLGLWRRCCQLCLVMRAFTLWRPSP